jgi:hypothetical protein
MATTVTFRVYVSAVVSTVTSRVRTAQSGDTNWGASLDASSADYLSTSQDLQEDKNVSGTGWVEYTIDPATVDWGNDLWVRIADTNEASKTYTQMIIHSNTGTNKPQLVITVTADETPQRCLVNVGT